MKLRNNVYTYLFSILLFSFSPILSDSSGISVEIDYLYWKPQQDQIFYASVIPSGFTMGSNFFNNTIMFVDQQFKNDSGVRAKLGYTFCEDSDSRLAITHLKNRSFGSINSPNGVVATGIFPLQDLTLLIGSVADAYWNLKYNTLDWEFGRYWDICEQLYLRSHVGLKWAKIEQSQLVNYPSFTTGSGTILKSNNFNGIGPRVGFNADWCFWRNLSLIGTFAASLLYGKFKGNTTIVFTSLNPNTKTTTQSPFCRKRLRPAVEMLAGANWKIENCDLSDSCGCDDINLTVGIGYEAQYWWNQWQTIGGVTQLFATLANNGDLMFHGLTAWASVEF